MKYQRTINWMLDDSPYLLFCLCFNALILLGRSTGNHDFYPKKIRASRTHKFPFPPILSKWFVVLCAVRSHGFCVSVNVSWHQRVLTASDSSVRFHPGSWIKRSDQLPFSRACWTSQLWALRSSTMISSSGLFPGRLGTEEIWRCLKMLGNPKSMISHGLSSFSQWTCVIFLVYLTFSDIHIWIYVRFPMSLREWSTIW